MGLLFKNNAETTLSSGINNSVTTVPVTSAAVFPTPNANNVFFATIEEGNNIEVVKVTGISSNDLTVVRAQDNTSAAAFSSGAKIELRLTAKVLETGTTSLTDLDGDTAIFVEQLDDEDQIRFDTAGLQRFLLDASGSGKFNGNVLLETAGKYFQVAGSSSTFWAVGSSGGSNPPGTASTTLAFHHWDGSSWNNEVEFNSSGDITLDGATYGGVNIPAGRDIAGNYGNWTGEKSGKIQFHANHVYVQTSGNFYHRNASGTNLFVADSNGHVIANGNITAYGNASDIKLKENVEVIDNPVDKIKQLKGVTFNYKKDGSKSTGLIAQDLEKVLPEAVYTSETIDNEINGEESEEFLAIRYGNTVGLLVEAIKELEARVKELESK